MTDIPAIAWLLLGFWLSMIVLMFLVLYTKLKKSKKTRVLRERKKSFKLIKGENVE